MRYMGFVKMDPALGEPPAALMEAMGEHVGKAIANGTFLDGGGLYAQSARTEVTVRAGEITSYDGPFAEGRETVGGFAVLELRDDAEAAAEARALAELHLQHWPGWEGSIDIRRIAAEDETGGK